MSRRLWLLLVAASAMGATAVFAHARLGSEAEDARFETTVVGRADMEETVSALGKLQPRDYVDVGAQASGQLLHLHVREGDTVHKGQLLAEIDPTLQQTQVEADRAEVARLEAQLVELQARAQFAQSRAERQDRLVRNQFASAEEHERARMEAAAATAQVDMTRALIAKTRATLRSDEAQLRYTKVYAPMDGTVVSVEARQGQTLVATYQTPQLLRIADLSVMTVWTQVAEADVPRLKAGMPVWFTTLGHPGQRWEGQVRQILPGPVRTGRTAEGGSSPAATANAVVLYTALFDVPNPEGELRPEMSAQTFFVTEQAKDALTVPVGALQPIQGDTTHFAVRILGPDGAPARRVVKVGMRTRFSAEVIEGLKEGERVVTGERAEEGRTNIRFMP